LAFINLVF